MGVPATKTEALDKADWKKGYLCNRCNAGLKGSYVVKMNKPDDPDDDEPLCYGCAQVTPNEEINAPSSNGPLAFLVGVVVGVVGFLVVKGLL